MEQYYKKVDNIDDRVKEASMPYMQWKVLFLVGENTNAEEISSLLKEDKSSVEEILASLESKALIEKVEEVKAETSVDDQPQEETAPSIGDELLIEEEEVISQVDEKLESATDKPQEEKVTEEPESAGEPETVIPDLEETLTEPKEEPTPEPESKEEESFSLEPDMVDEGEITPEEKEDTATADLPPETESTVLEEDEFELKLDEPETAAVEEAPAEEEPATAATPDEEIISDGTKKTVMVIDDSIVIRKMIEIALEEEDFNIVTAISGKEGLEAIEKENPHIVILDMMLPDMNGIEVLKTIKAERKLPVIMLSGKDSPQLIETAKEVGVDDFLPKPFRDEELVEKVKTLVEV